MSLVSVIIPCFNSERWIGDAIESALRQTHDHLEVVVVDDGSVDDSLSVIRSFGERVRWESGENRGACAARNRGLALAQGDYIQFLDSDDLLHPKKIERQLAVLRDSPDSLVYSLHEVVSLEPDAVAPKQWNRRTGCEDPIAFMLQGDLPTPAPLHRRSTLMKLGGFNERFSCAQDREFHLRIALAGLKFQLVSEVLFTIRRRSGSIGTSNELRIHEYRGELAISAYQQLVESGRLNEQRRVACAAMCARAARGLLLANPEIATRLKRQAYAMHPSGARNVVYSAKGRLLASLLGDRTAERVIDQLRKVQLPRATRLDN